VALLVENPGGELPFTRLDELVRALELLGLHDTALLHKQRLNIAGFVPMQPYP
jgi:hypothetical protein